MALTGSGVCFKAELCGKTAQLRELSRNEDISEKYRLEPYFTKPKIDFFFQVSVQFGRRAAKRRGEKVDISENVGMPGLEPGTT